MGGVYQRLRKWQVDSKPVSLPFQLKTYADRVEARLDELLPSADRRPFELHQAMRYSCLAPGKRLRPGLCMASAEALGGAAGDVLDAGCALEMAHCFSLIHDDLPAIDDDDLRRGMLACHKKFGEAIAILAGDALFALAYQTLSECDQPAERVVRCLQIFSKAVGSDGLVGGEIEDVLMEGREVDEATLQYIHTHKTGALISASCLIGGILVGGTEVQLDALEAYGRHVGLAFQIADDILNETSTPEQLGKAAGSDRLRNKATYPALFGLPGAQDAASEAVAGAERALEPLDNPKVLLEFARYAIDRLH
jgi:geranylgeranyl diphosphate synthase, type II